MKIHAIRVGALVALVLSAAACASTEPAQPVAAVSEPVDPVAVAPEFHDAAIGRDSLRSLLNVEQ